MEGIETISPSAPITEPANFKTTRASTKRKGVELVQPLDHQKKPRSLKKIEENKKQNGSADSNSESPKMDEKLQSLINQETHTTKDVLQAILESNRIVSARLDPIEAALHQVTDNTKQIKSVKKSVLAVSKKHDALSDKVAILEQAQLDNQASITGFKFLPDEALLKNALTVQLGVNRNAIVRISSFVIKLQNKSSFVVTNVHFINAFEKGKFLEAKRKKGDVKAIQLIPNLTEEQGSNEMIYIGNKLTSANNKIRKALKQLQASGKIHNKRFKFNRFQVQITNSETWKDVSSITSLNALFPEKENFAPSL